MPRRTDLKKILIIGSGPIVIGQACEFDYSGTQAIKALKEEGYTVVLVNSNPATIMTDPELADTVYIEPITIPYLTKIIEIERPDAILPTVGGQTGLNSALELARIGVLAKYNVELIGANQQAIAKAEDRQLFKQAMEKIGLAMPRAGLAHNLKEAETLLEEIGLPVILRPSFTLGGAGSGVCYNKEDFQILVKNALSESPASEVLIDQSIIGWKEIEIEIIRDLNDNAIIICSIENFDPMGVHTGDSITVAPQQTLTDREYQDLRDMSIRIMREIGVEAGGSNIQFAVNPKNGDVVVIEMNPRVSRSSALASKATGFPIAKIAAKLAVGYTLDELKNDMTQTTPASFEPTIDYVVTKVPRFTFEKFPESSRHLDTQMRSVGETMALGRTFPESFQKAFRSLETGSAGWGADGQLEIPLMILKQKKEGDVFQFLQQQLSQPSDQQIFYLREAMLQGMSIEVINKYSMIDPWFLNQLKRIIDMEAFIKAEFQKDHTLSSTTIYEAKQFGFSDHQLGYLINEVDIVAFIEKLSNLERGSQEYLETTALIEERIKQGERRIRLLRKEAGLHAVFKRVDTCAGELDSHIPYLYSTYEEEDEANVSDRKKILILGGGPNRIGQGIEFDYCCCHASFALQEYGIESIMVNSNPETVSTDYDTSDRLYFEPLTVENILEIYHKEQQNGEVLGVILQFGGQTPLKLARALTEQGVKVLGTSVESIERAEDRRLFNELIAKLQLNQPLGRMATSSKEALQAASEIGYPVLVRPSFVLGGRAMVIVHNTQQLRTYMQESTEVTSQRPVLIDQFLQNATEVDVDAICDGEHVTVAGVLEHIEEAGVHSGDSACILPTKNIPPKLLKEIDETTKRIALELEVKGLINIQYAIYQDKLYVLEVNPRASRTAPFIAKATGKALVKLATGVIIGKTLKELKFTQTPKLKLHYAKEAVLPFKKFVGVDTILGPEMKSTGEVMGIGKTPSEAFYKSQLAAGMKMPVNTGNIFVSVNDASKKPLVEALQQISQIGFKLIATKGTADFLEKYNVEVERINKVHEGRPHIVDSVRSGNISMIINIPTDLRTRNDALEIRLAALQYNLPYFTTVAAAREALLGMIEMQQAPVSVYPLP